MIQITKICMKSIIITQEDYQFRIPKAQTTKNHLITITYRQLILRIR